MNKLQWTIRKLKWMTPKEEKILVDNMLLYFTGFCFAVFMLVIISAAAAILIRGLM